MNKYLSAQGIIMPEKKINLHEMVMEFEKGLTAGTPFDITIFVKDYDKEDKTKLIEELIYSEIELCLKKNQSRKSADYKNQFPDLFSDQTIALKIINHEVQTLANYDLPIDPKSYFKLFPELEEQLSSLFEKMNLIPPTIPGYTILEEIGRGGMGVVYRAAQHSLKRIVAIKIIKDRAGLGSTMGDQPKKRFIAETSLLASLQHPNVVSIFESGEIKGNRYLVMEFVEGTNTKKILEKGVYGIQKAVSMILIIANAVHYFNQKGIIHRDLKPENILLTLNGEPKIADFGLAKSLYVDDGMTQDGFLIGTPEYLAPEQAEMDNRKPSPSIDVYGVGAIFYTLLTGNPPFPRSNLLETLNKVKNQEVASVKAQRPETPKDLDTIIQKCLQKKPSARYSSALELAEDLNRFNQGLPIQATTPGILTKLFKYSLRNKLLVLLFAFVIISFFSSSLKTYFDSLEIKKHNIEIQDTNDKITV
jgi:serine/threonine protein kinase